MVLLYGMGLGVRRNMKKAREYGNRAVAQESKDAKKQLQDIEEMYKKICENGYEVITDGIEQLPFWDNGVKFFMIKGPNEERIEFCQKL